MVRKFILVKMGKECDHFLFVFLKFLHIWSFPLATVAETLFERTPCGESSGMGSAHNERLMKPRRAVTVHPRGGL